MMRKSNLQQAIREASRVTTVGVIALPSGRSRKKTFPAPTKILPCVACLTVALLTGCQIGPKYVRPTAPAPPAYKESNAAKYSNTPPGTWQPANPQDVALKGNWWEIFHEPELNALEAQLNINNQDIAVDFQNFMAARDVVREVNSQFFPTVSGGPAYQRVKEPSAATGALAASTTGITRNNFELTSNASWAPDIWGKIRNELHESEYAAQVSAADLAGEQLTEQASLAEFYFELRGQDSLQRVYNQMVEADKETLQLTKALLTTGIDDEQAVAEEQITLENDEATAAGIATNRAIYEHAIAVLIGRPASSFSMAVRDLTTPLPPIPVGVPSQLLERRPDIAAAERTLAQANALVGVEKTAFYPTVTLTGGGGLESTLLGNLFSTPALFWSTGASASELIFDAGLRRATVAQYEAEYKADVATYRETVLTAFQEVEDEIATLRVSTTMVQQQDQAIHSAQRSLDLERSRYQTGLDPYLNVLSAQMTLLNDQELQLTSRITEMTAAVALVESLGGGWDANQLPAASKVTSKATVRQVAGTP
ncbi:MAG: efflux transporter outer membrane subunit [Acidobacteriaceae bacterium]